MSRAAAWEISGQTFGTLTAHGAHHGVAACRDTGGEQGKNAMFSSRIALLTRITVGGSPATSSVPAKIGHAAILRAGCRDAIGVAAPLPAPGEVPVELDRGRNVSPSRSPRRRHSAGARRPDRCRPREQPHPGGHREIAATRSPAITMRSGSMPRTGAAWTHRTAETQSSKPAGNSPTSPDADATIELRKSTATTTAPHGPSSGEGR